MSGYKIVFTQPGQVAIEPLEAQPLQENQVRVRTEVSLVSVGTEMAVLNGEFPKDSKWHSYAQYPFIPGYNNVGVVEACGKKVTDFKPGDRVTSPGPHATWFDMPADALALVPEGVSSEAATFEVLAKTVMNGVRLGSIQFGESVVIVGAGILGNLASQFASLSGARPVIVTDLSEERLSKVPKLPGVVTVPVGPELEEKVKELCGGKKANVVYEITGAPKGIESSLKLVRRQGRVVILGSPRDFANIDWYNEIHLLGLHIIGAHVTTHPNVETPENEWTREQNSQLFLSLLANGELRMDELVTHRFRWDEAVKVYSMLQTDRTQALGVILNWQ